MSYFQTVTSIQSDNSFVQKAHKPVNKTIKENEQIYYQQARENYTQNQITRLASPLFQNTSLVNEHEKTFKPSVKNTALSNNPTGVFDFTAQRKEKDFKPHCIKVTEPGANSDLVYKPQLKQCGPAQRNPITSGDPKSEYVRAQNKAIQPKNQIQFVG